MFTFIRNYRSVLALLLGLSLLAAACGSDADSSEAADDSGDATTETETTTESEPEPEPEAEAEAEPEADDAMEEEATGDASDGILIDLGNPTDGEFSLLIGADELSAGELSFAVVNNGENPHAFAIARGASYEDLPQKENGAVDTEALGDAYLGTTANLQSGETEDITFELEAGDYVFFCPVEFGPNSHARAGQVVSVSVG